MKYTVLLLRPDYIADEFGKDTYMAHVEASGVDRAIRTAQFEAVLADEHSLDPGDEDWVDHTDYHVLFVGHHHLQDLKDLPE